MSLPARVLIVGAGVGGLAAAIELAWGGCKVTVIERGPAPGGKLAPVQVAGLTLDSGPTVLTMKWAFEELFASVGRSLDRYVTLEREDVLARHAWPDGTRLDLFADPARSADAIAAAFGAREAGAFRSFLARGQAIYETVEGPFLRAQRPGLADTLRRATALGPGALRRIDPFRSMWSALTSTFADPRLVQLFARYATYCGSSPFEAPATLNLVAYVEQQGVYRVKGGMRALGEALASVARELGVAFHFGAHANRIVVVEGRARGVTVDGYGTLEADAVLFNGDVGALGAGHLGRDAGAAVKSPGPERASLSAITWAVVGEARGFPLAHHNVFFASDYPREFQAIFGEGRCPDEPTVYACAQGRDVVAGELGEEKMLLVVNAPPTGAREGAWTDEDIDRWQRAALSTLNRCGLILTPRASKVTTPADFHRRFPGTGGALYGARSRGALSALSRPRARSKLPGLYLAGGSVHPGPGVPMATLSGRLAAAQILEDLASTRRSSRAATSGTTSTP